MDPDLSTQANTYPTFIQDMDPDSATQTNADLHQNMDPDLSTRANTDPDPHSEYGSGPEILKTKEKIALSRTRAAHLGNSLFNVHTL